MLKEFNKLSPEEVKKFKDFVYSPYFNKSNSIIKLFSYLNSKHPLISDNDLSVKAIGIYLSEEGKVNEVYTRKIISNFNNVFESFLVQEEIKNDEIGSNIKLLQALKVKRMEKQFLKIYKNTRSKSNLQLKDERFYLNELKLLELYVSLDFKNATDRNCNLFQQIEDAIDLFYVLDKVHYFNLLSGLEVYHEKKFYKMTFKKEILEFIEKNKNVISGSHPYIYLEYLAFIMNETFNEVDENKFINYFKSLQINSINQEYIQLYLYKLEYHYKIGFTKKFNTTHYSKLLDLYSWSFENGYFKFFLTEGILYESVYFYIINLALNEKKFKWVSMFIEDTKNLLYPKNSIKMFNLGNAMLRFSLKEYDDCFRYIHKIKLGDGYYYFHAKLLLAKIFFEVKDYKASESIISSMSKYNKMSKKIIPAMRDIYKVNLSIFKKLLKFANEKSYKNVNKLFLKKEILNHKKLDFLGKSWYLEVLEKF